MQSPDELVIDGKQYRVGKMTPLEQFHVSRRLLPILRPIAEMLRVDATKIEDPLAMFMAAGEELSKLPDESANYVIARCMFCVHRMQGERAWARIARPGGETGFVMAFDDIQMPQMMQLVFAVLQENLGNFFGALPSTSQGGASPQALS